MDFERTPYFRDPFTKSECLAAWKQRGTVTVPVKNGPVQKRELEILRMVEASSINELPIDILITAATGRKQLPLEFAVVFADQRPKDGLYPLPVLWRYTHGPSPGEWVRPAPRL